MTVFSTLRHTKQERLDMEAKKAEMGVLPAIDFWPKFIKKNDDSSDLDVLKMKKDILSAFQYH